MAVEHNITADDQWFTGEDKSLVFTVYQSDGSTAEDITGWSLSWMLKRNKRDADADALITKTTGDGIALTTPESGVCTVSVADTETEDLRGGRYYHELKRTDAGSEAVLSYGSAQVQQSIHGA